MLCVVARRLPRPALVADGSPPARNSVEYKSKIKCLAEHCKACTKKGVRFPHSRLMLSCRGVAKADCRWKSLSHSSCNRNACKCTMHHKCVALPDNAESPPGMTVARTDPEASFTPAVRWCVLDAVENVPSSSSSSRERSVSSDIRMSRKTCNCRSRLPYTRRSGSRGKSRQ